MVAGAATFDNSFQMNRETRQGPLHIPRSSLRSAGTVVPEEEGRRGRIEGYVTAIVLLEVLRIFLVWSYGVEQTGRCDGVVWITYSLYVKMKTCPDRGIEDCSFLQEDLVRAQSERRAEARAQHVMIT